MKNRCGRAAYCCFKLFEVVLRPWPEAANKPAAPAWDVVWVVCCSLLAFSTGLGCYQWYFPGDGGFLEEIPLLEIHCLHRKLPERSLGFLLSWFKLFRVDYCSLEMWAVGGTFWFFAVQCVGICFAVKLPIRLRGIPNLLSGISLVLDFGRWFGECLQSWIVEIRILLLLPFLFRFSDDVKVEETGL